MRRFTAGVVVGVLLAACAPASAGWFKSGLALYRERGSDRQYFLGYVAGVHDLLAGYYPNHGYTLGALADRVSENSLKADGEDLKQIPGAAVVAAAMLELKMIQQEDALRIVPASVLERWRRENAK